MMKNVPTCASPFFPPTYLTPDEVIQHYTFLNYLGQGMAGVVYSVIKTDQEEQEDLLALKIIRYDEGDVRSTFDEVIYGCYLDNLRQYTEGFIPILEWWFMRDMPFGLEIPYDWVQGVENVEDLIYVVYTMPLALGTLQSVSNLTSTLVTDCLFELIYSYWVAHHLYGFIHQDISEDNILITEVPYSRVYQLRDHDYIVTSRYLPRFSDYENVFFLKPGNPYYQEDLDVEYLLDQDLLRMTQTLESFVMRLPNDEQEPYNDFLVDLEHYPIGSWVDLLMTSPIFNLLRRDISPDDVVKIYHRLV